MAIDFNGAEPTAITFNGVSASRATLNNVIVWEAGSAFTQTNAGITFSISNQGIVTFTLTQGSIVTSSFSNGQDLGPVSLATSRTNAGTLRVPNDPVWSNANTVIVFSVDSIQPAQPTFGFGDAGVGCSIDSAGNLSVSSVNGFAQLAPGQVTSYPLVSSDTLRSVSVRITGTVPSGFTNSGSSFDLTGNCNTIQPAAIVPTFGLGNITVSCSVNGQTGDVTATTNVGTLVFRAGQVTNYPLVTVDTFRSILVNVSGNVQAGFTNAGDPYSFNIDCPATQPEFVLADFTEADWTGSVSVNPLGGVLIDSANATSVTTTPVSFPTNTTSNPIDRTFTDVTLGVPAGFGNSGGTISFSRTVSQPSNLPVFDSAAWTGTAVVNQDGSILAGAGNAFPLIGFTPTSYPANTGTTAIDRTVDVEVTIPGGFQNFGSAITFTVLASQTFPMPTFDNRVSYTDTLIGLRVSPTVQTFTGSAAEVRNGNITVIPEPGYAFIGSDAPTASTTNSVIAAPGIPQPDMFGLGLFNIPVTSTIGSLDQNATITVGGTITRTANFSISPDSITRPVVFRTVALTANEDWEIWGNVLLRDTGGAFIGNGDLSDLGITIAPDSGTTSANLTVSRVGTPTAGVSGGVVFIVPQGATGVIPYNVQLTVTI